jgi:hypothetical protein
LDVEGQKMNSKLMRAVIFFATCAPVAALSDTTNLHNIEKLTFGPNGLHGTSVVLENSNFNGCSISSAALVEATNPNYQSILSALLAARMADKPIRISYSGCSSTNSNYPIILEVQL